MTPLERMQWQRQNRHKLYAILAGLVIAVLVLRVVTKVTL